MLKPNTVLQDNFAGLNFRALVKMTLFMVFKICGILNSVIYKNTCLDVYLNSCSKNGKYF